MTYPREHESIVRACYSTLIERGTNSSLAVLVSEIMGRDAAGMERSQTDREHVRLVVAALNDMTPEQLDEKLSRQTIRQLTEEAA